MLALVCVRRDVLLFLCALRLAYTVAKVGAGWDGAGRRGGIALCRGKVQALGAGWVREVNATCSFYADHLLRATDHIIA